MRFCTYFDGRYAARALLMLRSLDAVLPGIEVWALALDDRAAALAKVAPAGVRFVPRRDLLEVDPLLARVRESATAERGWLMIVKPAWLAFVLRRLPSGETLTYVDADMTFLQSPVEAIAESGPAPITLSPQRFTAGPRAEQAWGRFNAGWIGLRHDATALRFLEDWRQDCVDHVSPAYSNQKFLDRVPGAYPGVHVSTHPGVNVAHWNVAGVALGWQDGRVTADGRPLVAYHMAGLFPLPFGRCATGVRGRVLRGVLKKRVYDPYLRDLRAAAREIAIQPVDALDRVHWPQGLAARWWLRLLLLRGWARGGALHY